MWTWEQEDSGPCESKQGSCSARLVNRETPLSPLEEMTIFRLYLFIQPQLMNID